MELYKLSIVGGKLQDKRTDISLASIIKKYNLVKVGNVFYYGVASSVILEVVYHMNVDNISFIEYDNYQTLSMASGISASKLRKYQTSGVNLDMDNYGVIRYLVPSNTKKAIKIEDKLKTSLTYHNSICFKLQDMGFEPVDMDSIIMLPVDSFVVKYQTENNIEIYLVVEPNFFNDWIDFFILANMGKDVASALYRTLWNKDESGVIHNKHIACAVWDNEIFKYTDNGSLNFNTGKLSVLELNSEKYNEILEICR